MTPDTAHILAFAGCFAWGVFTYALWRALKHKGVALAICHENLRWFEQRLEHIQKVAEIQGKELDRTTAQLTHALGGDCEGTP